MIQLKKSIMVCMAALAAMTASAQDKTYWGYADYDVCSRNVGIRFNTGSEQGFAIKLSKEKAELLKGTKITGLGALFATANAQNVKAFVTRELGGENLYEMNIDRVTPRFTDYKFAEPYTIEGGSDLFFGFTLKYTGEGAQVMSHDQSADLPAGMAWGYNGKGWETVKYGGAPAILLLIEDEPVIADAVLKPMSFAPFYTAGKSYSFYGQINNPGTEVINSLDLVVRVGDGEETVTHLDNMDLKPNKNYNFEISNYTVSQSGNLPFHVSVKNVNGKDDADPTDNVTEETKYIYPAEFKKRVLMELFTGMDCPNCPKGHTLLENAIAGREDVVLVEHHTFNIGDPLSTSESMDYLWYFNSQNTYAPGLMGNRSFNVSGATSPVVEAVTDKNIQNVLNNALNMPPYVGVEMTTAYDEASRQLTATVYVTTYVMPDNEQNSLNVFLTQSGITEFYQQGAGGNYAHNHAMRASLTGVWGEPIDLVLGETVQKTYTYTLPEHIQSTAAPDKDQVKTVAADMDVVAFVLGKTNNATTNQVYNAVSLPLTGGTTVGIDETPAAAVQQVVKAVGSVLVFDDCVADARVYNLSGMKVAAGVQQVSLEAGMYIVEAVTSDGNRITQKIIISK